MSHKSFNNLFIKNIEDNVLGRSFSMNIPSTLLISITILTLFACKKFVKIDEPVDSITTAGAFSSDATATSAVVGIYSKLVNTQNALNFGSGGTTLYVGLSADEVTKVGVATTSLGPLYLNNLAPDNELIQAFIWQPAYFAIYQSNSSLEGLQKSNQLSPSTKNELIGECKFIRAFCYFYLVNLWGDIPMPLTGDWNQTYLLPRVSKSEVYDQVLKDLKDAQELLPDDYSAFNNERIRPNKFAAAALLARVYLYQQGWSQAEAQSTTVINNSSAYSLISNLFDVFRKNSTEAILQFQPSNKIAPFTVVEGSIIQRFPYWLLTDTLANSFETADQRKDNWTAPKFISGKRYYQPYKYFIDYGDPGGNVPQYYMVLRLAEQYLIRAEARAQQNKISESLADLNIIRSRAGLSDTITTDKQTLLKLIEHERQVELFAEWGHRWFDLIRTNRANEVLTGIKGNSWQPTDQLYPIPRSEMQKNPNLTQNQGY
jgi:starch-binding outer membrane protein, SusD/RagB family